VTASWIDKAGEGRTADYSELATRCIADIESADILLLYCEPGELLKGALIEAGIALALGKQVRCVGECASLSRVFNRHPLWRQFATVNEALNA
jgi:nucleoside 2-deoxyribosyltransferase